MPRLNIQLPDEAAEIAKAVADVKEQVAIANKIYHRVDTQEWPFASISNGIKWKCRAETAHDVVSVSDNFNPRVRVVSAEFMAFPEGMMMPDMQVVVESSPDVGIEEIREWMRQVENAHVMRQSLRSAELYTTGERDDSVQ
jgi:hypothetical protein